MDAVINFVNSLVGGNTYVSSALVSLIPLIELKGGILFARETGLGFLYGFLLPYLGSTVVFLPIFFLLKPILNFLKKVKWFNTFALKVESYFEKKADEIRHKKNNNMSESMMKMIGVFVFVAIPLPMTGVWTGTAIAVFLNLKFKEVILPIVLGNMIAGLIISVLAELFLPYVDIILWGLLGLAVILLAVVIIKISLSKPRTDGKEE